MLYPDELGEKGESRFKEICADASLICNKSDRDRTGWDFIVEFPFSSEQTSLDSRNIPLSCHIQVKTIASKSTTVRLLLSAAERLAKEIKPTFIYVFCVDEKLNFTKSFLIHLSGGRLAAILKRLRKEKIEGKTQKINKKYITFTPQENEKLPPTGAALRSGLINYCGLDIHLYANKKKHQLESLGYENGNYKGRITFSNLKEEELLDTFLGLKKMVPLEKLATFHTRFGIDVPFLSESNARITIEPRPVDNCIITVRESKLSQPAIFKAQLFIASLFDNTPSRVRALFRSATFEVLMDINPDGRNSCTFNYDLPNLKKTHLTEWEMFWRMMKIFSTGRGSVEIRQERTNKTLQLPIANFKAKPNDYQIHHLLQYFNEISRILNQVGILDSPELTYAELEETQKEVHILSQLLNENEVDFSFSYTSSDIPVDLLPKKPIILTKVLRIDKFLIAYYGVGSFLHNQELSIVKSRSKNFRLKELKVISSMADYDDFVNSAQSTELINDVFRFDDDLIQSVFTDVVTQ